MSTLHDICCNKHITQCNCSVNSAKAVVVLLGTNLIALQHVRSKMHVCMLNLFLALISLCPDKNTIIVDTKRNRLLSFWCLVVLRGILYFYQLYFNTHCMPILVIFYNTAQYLPGTALNLTLKRHHLVPQQPKQKTE